MLCICLCNRWKEITSIEIWTVKNKTEKTALKLIMLMIPTVCTFHGIINDVVITAIALSSSNSVGFRDGSRKFRKRVNRSTQPRISLVKYRRRRRRRRRRCWSLAHCCAGLACVASVWVRAERKIGPREEDFCFRTPRKMGRETAIDAANHVDHEKWVAWFSVSMLVGLFQ